MEEGTKEGRREGGGESEMGREVEVTSFLYLHS